MSKASLALALAASAGAEDLFGAAHGGCRGMLSDIAALGHSDAELSAFCRASMPPQLCRDAFGSLGQQPWPADRIASACQTWENQWNAALSMAPGREAMDFNSLQQTLNGCLESKAKAGLCQKPSGKPMALNECVDHKQEVYPKQMQKYNDAINHFYSKVMGAGTPAPDANKDKPVPLVGVSRDPHAMGFGGAAAPKLLAAPKLPALPTLPAAPKLPTLPTLPAPPKLPKLPTIGKGEAKGALASLIKGAASHVKGASDTGKSTVKAAADKASGKAEAVGPVATLGGSKLYLLAGPGLAVAALAAGAAVLKRLRRRPAAALLEREALAEEDVDLDLMPADPVI